jgi:hypothetical protein
MRARSRDRRHAESDICRVCVRAVSFSADVEARGSAPGAKADRADARPLARDCSGNAWPYFEASCLRDTRNPFGQARDARVVSLGQAAAAKAKPAQ